MAYCTYHISCNVPRRSRWHIHQSHLTSSILQAHKQGRSLCTVDNPQGVVPNRFRFMSPPREGLKPSNIDIGRYCTKTCAIEPNASVYCLGRGGIRTGKIEPSMSLVWPREGENLEWYLQLDGQIVQEELSNDAGAWVLKCDGNQLMAQLWGYTNEHLVITLIEDLFHDIKDVTGAISVELPKDAGDSRFISQILVHSKASNVQRNGSISDKEGNVGKIMEDNLRGLVGRSLNEHGEVLDEHRDVIRLAAVLSQEARSREGPFDGQRVKM